MKSRLHEEKTKAKVISRATPSSAAISCELRGRGVQVLGDVARNRFPADRVDLRGRSCLREWPSTRKA
jgi:hypothetical protein